MTSKDKLEDPVQYQADVEKICETYELAARLHEQGTHVVCTDEKTGMQALERKFPTKPTKPGLIERQEFEYIRRGTQVLIANFHVATGRVIESTISARRAEADFAGHIRNTISSDPQASWVFVVDQLDTHKSESLVLLVAEHCGLNKDLGKKGQRGILKTMATRRAFLEDESHSVRFVYTPRHCSWLNQVEIWFSILVRRLLKRGSFPSLENQRDRIEAFINYFNEVLAKPFKWTYTGRVLQS